MNDDVTALERRIVRVERTNRWLTVTLVMVSAAAIVGFRGAEADDVAASSDEAAQEVVRARRIQLVDGDGRVRIDLRHDDEETGIFIQDEAGDTRLGAAHFAHGGTGYALHGPGGRGAAVLYLKSDGSLTMYDAEGTVAARFPGADR